MERSSGRYAILRPHFFRWEIDDPDRQRMLVAGDVRSGTTTSISPPRRSGAATGEEQQFDPWNCSAATFATCARVSRWRTLGGPLSASSRPIPRRASVPWCWMERAELISAMEVRSTAAASASNWL
jgi:hypothetical protein